MYIPPAVAAMSARQVHAARCTAKKYAAYPASSASKNIPNAESSVYFSPISFFIAASADKQGVQSAKNAKNASPCSGVNTPASGPHSKDSEPATASFANSPLKIATDTRQSVMPIG